MELVFYLGKRYLPLLYSVVKESRFEGSAVRITRANSIVAYLLVLTMELKIVMISV
ncbi:hypothetical protein D3C74_481080 [compost metagenome]